LRSSEALECRLEWLDRDPGRNPPEPPEGIPVATGGIRNGPIDSDDDEPARAGPTNAAAAAAAPEDENLVSPLQSDDEFGEEENFHSNRISDLPPTLPGIEIGESGIELPSRFPSKAASRASSRRATKTTDVSLMPDIPGRIPSGPSVPRKSSRRKSQSVDLTNPTSGFPYEPQNSIDSSRMPFNRSISSNRQSTISTKSSLPPPEGADLSNDRPTSVGYASQHTTRIIDQSDHPEFLGTAAEVVDGRLSGASSMEHARTDHS
jgi:hypothetical protein